MAILNVRSVGDTTSHLSKNPHIAQEMGSSREPFVEVPRVDALVNRDLFVAIISAEILAAARVGRPAPKFSQGALKETVKIHLLNFGVLGCMKWHAGLAGEDILELQKQASAVLYATVPDMFAGVATEFLPALPAKEEVEESTEIITAPAPAEGTVMKPPATDLTPADLNNMSRSEMIVELEARGYSVPKSIAANAAKKKLLELIAPSEVEA